MRQAASISRAWIAVIYLGAFGGAAAFFLWVLALRMTTPTRVANTMTVNPIAASLLAALIVGRADRLEPDRRPGRGRGAAIWLAASERSANKKMSRAKALLGYLDAIEPLSLDRLVVIVEAAAGARAVGLSPSQDLDRFYLLRAQPGLRFFASSPCLAGGTLTDLEFACHHANKTQLLALQAN